MPSQQQPRLLAIPKAAYQLQASGLTMVGLLIFLRILGYFIAGLLPLWASWLLTICLVVVAVSTLASKVLQLEAAHQALHLMPAMYHHHVVLLLVVVVVAADVAIAGEP